MSAPTALSTYRSLMRVARAWHYDPQRSEKSLHELLRTKIRAQFKENKNITDTHTVSFFLLNVFFFSFFHIYDIFLDSHLYK